MRSISSAILFLGAAVLIDTKEGFLVLIGLGVGLIAFLGWFVTFFSDFGWRSKEQ